MTSEDYLNTRIQELERSEKDLKERLKGYSSLSAGKKFAWYEGYQAAHNDIQLLDPQPNPYLTTPGYKLEKEENE